MAKTKAQLQQEQIDREREYLASLVAQGRVASGRSLYETLTQPKDAASRYGSFVEKLRGVTPETSLKDITSLQRDAYYARNYINKSPLDMQTKQTMYDYMQKGLGSVYEMQDARTAERIAQQQAETAKLYQQQKARQERIEQRNRELAAQQLERIALAGKDTMGSGYKLATAHNNPVLRSINEQVAAEKGVKAAVSDWSSKTQIVNPYIEGADEYALQNYLWAQAKQDEEALQRDNEYKNDPRRDAVRNKAYYEQLRDKQKASEMLTQIEQNYTRADRFNAGKPSDDTLKLLKQAYSDGGEYAPTIWDTAARLQNEYQQYVDMGYSDEQLKLMVEQSKARNTSEISDIDSLVQQLRSTGAANSEEYIGNINRHKAELERQNKDLGYLTVGQEKDFAEVVEQAHKKEYEAPFAFGVTNELLAHYAVHPELDFLSGTGAPATYMPLLTQEERDKFLYLYEKKSPDAARTYYDHLTDDVYGIVPVRSSVQGIEKMAELTEKYPISSNLLSVPMNMMTGPGYMKGVFNAMLGKETSPYDPLLAPTRYVQTVRDKTNEMIGNEVGQFFYGAGMSLLENVARMAVFGTGGTNLFIAGSGAAADNYLTALDNGASSKQALLLGGFGGIWEAVFERVSLDKFIKLHKAGNAGTFIWNMLKQGGIEATEEIATEAANIITDIIVMGDMNKYEQAVKNYMEKDGLSEEQARIRATNDIGKNLLMTAASAFLTGNIMGAGGQAVNVGGKAQGQDSSNAAKSVFETSIQNTAQGTAETDISEDEWRDPFTGEIMPNSSASTAPDDDIWVYKGNKTDEKGGAAENDVSLEGINAAQTKDGGKGKAIRGEAYKAFAKTLDPETAKAYEKHRESNRGLSDKEYTEDFMRVVMLGKKGATADEIGQTHIRLNQDAITAAWGAGRRTGGQRDNTVMVDGQNTRVTGIKSIDKDGLTLETESGDVAFEDAEFADEVMSDLYSSAVGMDIGGANAMISGYSGTGDALSYAKDFKSVYSRAKVGAKYDTVQKGTLTSEQSKAAYEAGAKAKQGGKGGVIAAYSQDTVNKTASPKQTRLGIRILNALGKKYGRSIVIEDTISYTDRDGKQHSGLVNGYYNPADKSIHIALDAKEGALLFYAVHELTHSVEGSEAYTALADFVKGKIGSEDMVQRVKEITEKYAEAGIELKDGQPEQEVIANALPAILTDESVVKELVSADRTLAERIRDFFGEFFASLQETLDKLTLTDENMSEFAALANDKEAVRQAWEMLDRVLDGKGKTSGGEGGVVRYSASDNGNEEISHIKNQVRANIDAIKKLNSVVDIRTEGRAEKGKAALVDEVMEEYKATGYTVDRQGFGLIDFSRTSVNNAMNYVNSDAEYAAVLAAKTVAKKGIAIHKHKNHKSRGIQTFTFAAPVSVNGKSGIVAVLVKRTKGNRFAAARILTPDGTVFDFETIKDTEPTTGGGRPATEATAVYTPISSVPESSIPEPDENVNQYSLKPELPSEQADTPQFKRWFGKSKVVNEDGTPKVVYHGTDEQFFSFDMSKGRANMDIQGAFFSPWEEDAKGYGKNVGAFYLSIQNPADEQTAYKALRMFQGQNEAGKKAKEWLEAQGYDGVNNEGEEYIAFHPEQIKSATDNIGTFDPKNPDIRYSLRETENMSWDEQVDMCVNDKARGSETLNLGNSGDTYSEFGMDKLPIAMKISDLRKTMRAPDGSKSAHSLTEEQVRQLDKGVRKPVAVFNNPDRNCVYIVTGIRTSESEPIVATMAKNQQVGYDNAHQVKSAYGMRDIITYMNEHLPDNSKLLIWNTNEFIGLLDGNKKKPDTITPSHSPQWTKLHEIESRFPRMIVQHKAQEVNRYSLRSPDELKQEILRSRDNGETADVTELTRGALKEAGSRQNRRAFEDEVRATLDYLSSETDPDMNAALDTLTETCRTALEKAKTVNADHQDYVAPVKEYLRKVRITLNQGQRDEAANLTGSYNEYRKSLFGSVRLTNDGVGIDVAWQELSALNPSLFPPDTSEGDMPALLAAAANAIKPRTINNFADDIDTAAQEMAHKLISDYFGLDYTDDSAERRQQYEAALAKQEGRSVQSWTKAVRDAYLAGGEKMRQRYENLKASTKEREAKTKYRAPTEKLARDLYDRLRKPTDKKHVPEALRKPILGFLEEMIQYGGKKGEKWASRFIEARDALRKVEDGNMEGSLIDVDPALVPDMDTFIEAHKDVESVMRMDGKTLKELYDILKRIRHAVNRVNEMHVNGRKVAVDEQAQKAMNELDKRRTRKAHNGLADKVDKLMNIDMLDAIAFARELGQSGGEVIQAIRDGQDKKTVCVALAKDFIEQAAKDVDIKALGNRKTTAYTVTHEDGTQETLNMTRGDILSLYLLNKREQARTHIYGDGLIALDEKGRKRNIKAVRVTEADVARITDTLTEAEKNFGDDMMEFMSTVASEWGNEVSMELWGYKIFLESSYWPINVDDNSVIARDNKDLSKGSGELYGLRNLGMTKATKQNANNALLLGSALDTFSKHIDEMSSYSGFVVPLSDAMKWYNYKDGNGSVKASIERTLGAQGKQYFLNLIEAVNGTGASDVMASKLFDSFLRNAKIASVGANLSVIIQQPTAYLRAANEISPKYLAKAAVTIKRGGVKKAKKYSPIAQWKSWGFYETNIGKGLNELLFGESTVKGKLQEASLWAAGKADELTWGKLWNACELETQDLHPELTVGSEEYYQTVGKRLSGIIDRTQVVDTVFHRSQMMRSKGLAQLYSAFKSEPTKSYNLLRNAIVDVARAETKAEKKAAYAKLARAGTTMLVTYAANAALKSLIGALRDDEDEEFLEKYKAAFSENFITDAISMLPVVSDAVSFAQGYSPSRLDQQAIYKMITVFKKWEKFLSKDENKGNNGMWKLTCESAQFVSYATGVPVGALLRDMNAIYQAATGHSIGYESEMSTITGAKEMLFKLIKDGKKDEYARLYKEVKKMGANGQSPALIDKSIAKSMMLDPDIGVKVQKAYEAKKAGRLRDVESYRKEMIKLGFTGEMADSALMQYQEIQEGKVSTSKTTDTEKPLNAALYSADDVAKYALDGNAEALDIAIKQYIEDSAAQDPIGGLRTSLTKQLKEPYADMIRNDEDARAEAIKLLLTGKAGYSESTIDGWALSDPSMDVDDINDVLLTTTDVGDAKSALTSTYKPLVIERYMAGDDVGVLEILTKLESLYVYDKNGYPYYTESMINGWIDEYEKK